MSAPPTAAPTPEASAGAGLLATIAGLIDPATLVLLVFGLIAGAVWRTGFVRTKGETWAKAREDLQISAVTGLANFMMALVIVSTSKVGPFWAGGIAMVIGAKGTDAMKWFQDTYFKK